MQTDIGVKSLLSGKPDAGRDAKKGERRDHPGLVLLSLPCESLPAQKKRRGGILVMADTMPIGNRITIVEYFLVVFSGVWFSPVSGAVRCCPVLACGG